MKDKKLNDGVMEKNKHCIWLWNLEFGIYLGFDARIFDDIEPVSKRFSLVKVKESENFNRRNTLSILRIKI